MNLVRMRRFFPERVDREDMERCPIEHKNLYVSGDRRKETSKFFFIFQTQTGPKQTKQLFGEFYMNQ